MPRIKIDINAHKLLERCKKQIEDRGIEGVDFSDVIRELIRTSTEFIQIYRGSEN